MTSYALKDLSLVRTTSPDQTRQVWLSNQVQWGSSLDSDLWLDMADLRTHQDFGPGFGYQIWILVPTAQAHDPNATILSAAHTFDRPGYLTTRDKDDTPVLKDVRVANVLFVFTPVHFRRHGYGKYLMKLLWEHFDQEESTKTDFSFLYSATGPKFYETLGWKTLPSIELCIPTMDDGNVFEFPTIQHSASEPSLLEDITLDNLQDVVDKDISLLTSDLLSMTTNKNNRYLAILPNARCIKRHLKEAQFITQHVFHSQKSINRVGARILGGDGDAFILWGHRPQTQLLLILRLRYTTMSQLQALLKEAVQEAIAWQIAAVSVYGVDGHHVAVTTGLLNQERVGSLSCLGEFRTSSEMCPVELIIDEGFIWR